MSYPLTFDGEPSLSTPDLRGEDDAYMVCERCGRRTYMGDPTCNSCGETPVVPAPAHAPRCRECCDFLPVGSFAPGGWGFCRRCAREDRI